MQKKVAGSKTRKKNSHESRERKVWKIGKNRKFVNKYRLQIISEWKSFC